MDDLERKMWCVDCAVKFCDTPKEALQFARELTRFLSEVDHNEEKMISQTFMSDSQVSDSLAEPREVRPIRRAVTESSLAAKEFKKTFAERAANPKQLDLFEDQEEQDQKAHALPQLGTMLFDVIMAIRSILREGGKSNFRSIVKIVKAKHTTTSEQNISCACSNLRARGFIKLETGHLDGNQWVLTDQCIKQLEGVNV